MKIGIVGSEAAKFTPETEQLAREAIRDILTKPDVFRTVDTVISGGCHLGGIDIWAIEEAHKLGMQYFEYLPQTKSWTGYKKRNLEIANNSDILVCITVKSLPEGYKGMRFPLCYHCGTKDHVKSGGCWTMRQAKKLGKETRLIVI